MRLAPLLALCLALPLAAQTPDPNPPEAYYPLGLDDIREYRISGGAMPPRYLRERVIGDTLLGEQPYRLVLSVGYDMSGFETDRQQRAVRFDTLRAQPVEGQGNGYEQELTPCRLDLPFGDGSANCPVPYVGQPSVSVSVGGSVVQTSVKGFSSTRGDEQYAAGLGLTEWGYDGSEVVQRLTYARIAGVEYGTPDPILPPMGTPDPTPPWQYWPLAIGNLWEYANCEPPMPFSQDCVVVSRSRRSIVRDTTVEGVRYFVEQTTPLAGAVPTLGVRALRFDTTTATIRQLGEAGADAPITCRLDADFDLPAECYDFRPEYLIVTGGNGEKYYPLGEGGEGFRAGVGYLGWATYTIRGERSGTDLTFAFIAGQPVFGQPYVADESSPTAPVLTIKAVPNPTAGSLALSLTLPAPSRLTVEAFDALGRRVHRFEVTLGAGAQTVGMDARGWAPGVYIVRATTDGGEAATVHIVRH